MNRKEQLWQQGLEGTLGVPFSTGNRIEVLRNGVDIFPAMLNAIERAEHSIDMLTYVYWTGDIAERFATALSRRAQAGIEVRLLLDAVGAAQMRQEWIHGMKNAGVDVRWFREPVRWRFWVADHRTHRKVLVCDRAIGFTGGVGIAEEWEGDARNTSEWRDTHFRIEGPAVYGLMAAFLGNWAEAGGAEYLDAQRMPRLEGSGSAPVQVIRATASIGWSDVATVLRTLVQSAQTRLRIASAYFVPDAQMRAFLVAAAERGVQVQVMTPGQHHDERVSQLATEDDVAELLRGGVEIYRYEATMFHVKAVTVDACLACIGSANFNQRSMRKDDEIAMLVLEAATVSKLDHHFDQDLKQCQQLTRESWRKRGPLQRLGEWLVRPVRGQT